MLTIFKKEISVFFSSLTAYVIIGVFLLLMGFFLWIFPESSILDYGYAGLDNMFNTVPYIFLFLIPAICMHSIAEEKKDGTFELLATRPVTDWQILLGKYLACFAITVLTVLPTVIYYISIFQLGATVGNIDTGAVIGSYIGLLLLGAAFTSIGIFSSSITKNQIVAFVVAVFLCFFAFSGFDSLSHMMSLQSVETLITGFGINEHYQSLSRGVMDTRDLVYFLSFIALFLIITKTILGGRKW